MCRAKEAQKMSPQIIFIGEIRHVDTHTKLSNNTFPEKKTKVLASQKICQRLLHTLHFFMGQGTQIQCILQPWRGCTYWWLKETPHPIPVGPLHSFKTSLDLPNLSSSSQLKLWIQKVLAPFQCMQKNAAFPNSQMKAYSQALETCTWQSDLTSTLPPKSTFTKKHFSMKKA